MKIEAKPAPPEEAYIIKNLYPLYLHDLSGHYGLTNGPVLNPHGIFEESNEIRTLADQYNVQSIWWEKPGCLHPFLIRAGGNPAGFAFVATPPHCNAGVDYFVNEFFVLQPYRGLGYAQQAAVQIFERFKGRWELFTNPAEKNAAGQKFWRKTVSGYTKGNYAEKLGTTYNGEMLIFSFDNA
ncbi:GNAT family N-acetyltransferase [Paenibacillus sp. S150]|uniref:GNAT family N-acetyltransferase n=1 Tax=Paenibacillus sp. S150 TaxID=2749826 RepID=UPI001C590AA4|nr:GNAT family N-acetyltransferase [Paenibacillus sp. S150]MBW4080903.1 GNAT family N-acetyltransferase [Paenibacillus sp. S150]